MFIWINKRAVLVLLGIVGILFASIGLKALDTIGNIITQNIFSIKTYLVTSNRELSIIQHIIKHLKAHTFCVQLGCFFFHCNFYDQ